jgi:hypothetical protein
MARSCSTGSSGLLHALAQHHGAGAAVAFATAFLGAGAVQVFAQHFQQRAVGGTSCKVTGWPLRRNWMVRVVIFWWSSWA